MLDTVLARFRRLTLGQKFLASFGIILLLLGASLGAILFYLARINSYVDRHNRITIPAVVTAADMRRDVFQSILLLNRLEHARKQAGIARVFQQLEEAEARVRNGLDTYRANHAARTHPILFGMLTKHGQVGLADQEDRVLENISSLLREISSRRETLRTLLQGRTRAEGTLLLEATVDLSQQLTEALSRLIEVHTKIDAEMKVEGNLLLRQARFVILALVILLGVVITATYRVVNTQIASPLRRLARASDRVARGELQAGFDVWSAKDEVGELSASLASMLATLRDRTAALERKTRDQEAFSYSVAHDLKGPLREIEGFSSLIERKHAAALDPTAGQYLAMIRQSALRMTILIDALLRYSRIDQQSLPKSHVNLRTLVEHIVRTRQMSASGSHVRMAIELPLLEVWGEPTSIQQAIANLIDNAVKFSSHSESSDITIGGARGQAECVLWVRDNGVGFDPKHAGKLFGLFERLHASDQYEGTGVGLAIVKLVMDKHGGRAWADSSPGKGSTFYLAFPDSGERHFGPDGPE